MRSVLAWMGLACALAGCGERDAPTAPAAPASVPVPAPAASEPAARSVDCSEMARLDLKTTLSGADYLKLAAPNDQVARGSASRIGYRAFDNEDTIYRDGWKALGVVSVASAAPAGGVVWVKEAITGSPDAAVSLEAEDGGYVLKLGLGEVQDGSGWGRCAQDFVVRIDAGGALSAGG